MADQMQYKRLWGEVRMTRGSQAERKVAVGRGFSEKFGIRGAPFVGLRRRSGAISCDN